LWKKIVDNFVDVALSRFARDSRTSRQAYDLPSYFAPFEAEKEGLRGWG
jgi:hypothetical protein